MFRYLSCCTRAQNRCSASGPSTVELSVCFSVQNKRSELGGAEAVEDEYQDPLTTNKHTEYDLESKGQFSEV